MSRKSMFPTRWVVLPDRIELSTSPLPMECSTTELRQHVLGQESAAKGAYQAGRYLPQAPLLCKLARPVKTRKSGRYRGRNARFRLKGPGFPPIWVPLIPGQLASWPARQCRSILSFARSGRAGPLELPHSLGMLWIHDGRRERQEHETATDVAGRPAEIGAAREPEAAEAAGARARRDLRALAERRWFPK